VLSYWLLKENKISVKSEIVMFFVSNAILTHFPMEFLKNFNGFKKLFQNTVEFSMVKIHDFGPERGQFRGQSQFKILVGPLPTTVKLLSATR